MPVLGASSNDWNAEAFWHLGWGDSGVHKGIDIFADAGTSVISATAGLVLFTGERSLGGKVVLVLGPGGFAHYYAHMDTIGVRFLQLVDRGQHIGTVGTTGNAANKAPHLHYSVLRPLPDLRRYTATEHGVERMFYLDPNDYLGAR
ncbi:MAG: M23 family metallopeptidase [Pseudomonadales bacterium]